MNVDITKLSFEEWVQFVFDHPISKPEWYWAAMSDDEDGGYGIGDKPVIVRYLTRLFLNPGILRGRYAPEQLEQGFWFIMSHGAFTHLLWDTEIPWPLRKACIESMGELFERFFALVPSDTACFMWWDEMAYEYYRRDGVPRDADDADVQEAMFQTLRRILGLESKACQTSALHGLGHLRHAQSSKAIEAFISVHPDLDDELRGYAMRCRAGAPGFL